MAACGGWGAQVSRPAPIGTVSPSNARVDTELTPVTNGTLRVLPGSGLDTDIRDGQTESEGGRKGAREEDKDFQKD